MPRAKDATTYKTKGQIIADVSALVRQDVTEPLENTLGNCLSWIEKGLKQLEADRELDEDFAKPLENAYGNCLSWLDGSVKRLRADRELDEDTEMSEEKHDAEVAAQEAHVSKRAKTASVSLRRYLLPLHPLIRQTTQVPSTDDVKVAVSKDDWIQAWRNEIVSWRTDVLPLHPLTQ